MQLRPYQTLASERVLNEWESNASTLVVMPTGLGKTIMFADVIRRRDCRALVLAHREELIFQAVDKIRRVTGLQASVEMGDMRVTAGLLPSVVVATVQTLTAGGDGSGRLNKFDPGDFSTLIVDEAHHATSSTYRRVVDHFRGNPECRVLGVTATPDRSDEEALGQVFDTVAYDYEILDAIHDGWLVPIEQQMVTVQQLDYSGIRTTAGDLNGADLASVLETERNLYGVASPTLDIIGDRRALVFAASVQQAQRLAELFNRHRYGSAAWVCGMTPKESRREMLRDYAVGKIQIMVNCGVLTEGFDDPGTPESPLSVIVMARPTKSRSLYAQMCGRGTRPLPGIVDGPETADERKAAIAGSSKPSMLVIDFVGNAGRHKLISSADILGGKVSDDAIEAAVRHARSGGKPVRMDELLDREQERLQREQEDAARRAKLMVGVKWTAASMDPFNVFGLAPEIPRGWDRGKRLSEKQLALLARQGINAEQMPYHKARQLLNELFRRWKGDLCSFKQAKVLRKYGYSADCTFKMASEIIDRLAKNGWKRPHWEVAA